MPVCIFQPAFSFSLSNQNHENREASNKHIGQNNNNKTQFIIFPELFAYNDKNGKDNRAKDSRENSKNKKKCCHFYFLHVFVFCFIFSMVKVYHDPGCLSTLFLKKIIRKIWIVKCLTKSYFIALTS